MVPAVSSSQDASMFQSCDPISTHIPKRNSNYGQMLQARTEDCRGQPSEDCQGLGSKTSQNGHGDIDSAQILSARLVNSVEY